MSKPKKRDASKLPLHMQGDERIRNANIDAGYPLCDHCDGTGNELFSMYRMCPECNGTGIDVVEAADSPKQNKATLRTTNPKARASKKGKPNV